MANPLHDVTPASLVASVRAYAELYHDLGTPCLRMLRQVGPEGAQALGELIRSEADSDSETVACYAAELLAAFDHPAVVDILLEVLARPGTPYPDEVRESVFNSACGNRFLLDPRFLRAARELQRARKPGSAFMDLVEQFLRWAETQ